MLKVQYVLKKISENPDLIAEFKKTQNFNEIYNLCKKIEPNITETEVEEGIRELIIRSSTNSHLNNEELSTVTGGSMDFNKTKALALSALVLTGVSSASILSNVTYASDVPSTTNTSRKVEESLYKGADIGDFLVKKFVSIFNKNDACLGTNKYGIEFVSTAERTLRLQGNLFNSGMKFVKYEIKKENNIVFIYIYGALVSDSDFKEQEPLEHIDWKIPQTTPVIEPDFDIQYTIPDGVDAVYLRGNTKDDVKIVWKSE